MALSSSELASHLRLPSRGGAAQRGDDKGGGGRSQHAFGVPEAAEF